MEDKNCIRDNMAKMDSLSEVEELIAFPTATSRKLEEVDKLSPDAIHTTEENDKAIAVSALGAARTLNTGILDEDTEDTAQLRPIINDKPYGVSAVKVKGKKAGIRTRLGVTTPVKVVLYNSGFLYVTGEVGVNDENALMVAIGEAIRKVAIKTAGFSFSSDSLNLDEVVLDFVRSLIEGNGVTNLVIDSSDKTIWDYVSILDLPTIYLGLVKGIHPSSFRVVNACKNTIEVDDEEITNENQEDNDEGKSDNDIEMIERASKDSNTETVFSDKVKKKRLKCNAVITADVIPDTLLRYKPARAYIDRLRKPTLKPEDLEAYREAVGLTDETVSINFNGVKLMITLNDSSISRYLEMGQTILQSLTDIVDSVITSDDMERKQLQLSMLFENDKLMKYAHFIKRVEMPDGDVLLDVSELIDILQTISKDNKASEELISHIKKFITGRSCSIVGIAEYVCDECNGKAGGTSEDPEFRSIIPLNMQQLFFDIYNLK